MGALQRVMAFADAKPIDLEVDRRQGKCPLCAGSEARVRMRTKADVRRPL